jgi:hypothetical protein
MQVELYLCKFHVNLMQISLTFQVNLIFMNCFQVNRVTYKIQMTSYYVEEGESVEYLDGKGGGCAAWTRRRSGKLSARC